MDKAKKILVTGGAGYIGSHTVLELIKSGFVPIIVDDFRNSRRQIIEGMEEIANAKLILREIDVCDKKKLKTVFEEFQIDGIIHFAAYKAVEESVLNPLSYYNNNLIGILNCLELSLDFGVKNFLFSSSCTVYGEPLNSKTVSEESEILPPNSPYGNTKQIGEEIIIDLIRSGAALKALNLRYFNPVGAHHSGKIGELPLGKPNNLFPIISQVASGKVDSLRVNGTDYNTADGTCIRDYVHVSDVAAAHVNGIEWLRNQEIGVLENVNIGTGKGTSVLEIIHTFEDISGKKINWIAGERRDGDIEEIQANVDKSLTLLNWKSIRSVKDAVQDTWNWELNLKND